MLALLLMLAADDTAAHVEFFERRVRPLLAERCVQCHGPAKQKAGLRLDSAAGLKAGAAGEPVVVPGKPAESALFLAVQYLDGDRQMPPDGKLSDAAIADIRQWIERGAALPASAEPAAGKAAGFDLAGRKAAHWSWKPLSDPPLPKVVDAAWPLDDADRFVLAKLEAAALKPAGPADSATWLRRVTFDLTGLPPTLAEQDAFRADASPAARANVVDRLLASPAFGERQARRWMDLVRYAESRAHEFDYDIPNAWQYRDYLVRAFNADVPYDRLAKEHLAGDLLDAPRRHPTEGFDESPLGTAFWHLGEATHSPVDIAADGAERLDNAVDVASKAFLGLTLACARCHDHKFDALTQRDYYAFAGFAQGGSYRQLRFDGRAENAAAVRALHARRAGEQSAIGQAVAAALRPGLAQFAAPTPALRAELQAALAQPRHPLHAFALATLQPKGHAEKLAAVRKANAAVPMPAGALLDFARADAPFLPDDVGYGLAPARPGEPRFAGAGVRFAERHAAIKEAFADRLTVRAAQDETGALKGLHRPGRLLRTPDFKLSAPRLFYLVRGQGAAYAAVHQHGVIHGPLHGALVRSFPAKSEWRWEEHPRLAPYAGMPLHVEFWPAPGQEFEVAAVVAANEPPPLPTEAWPAELMTDAQGVRNAGAAALDRLAAGTATGADAALVNYLLERPALFLGERAAGLAKTLSELRQRVEEPLALMRFESRLAPASWEGTGGDAPLLHRGSAKAIGPLAPRQPPEAFGAKFGPLVGSGRKELAEWLCDPARNPYGPRVAANRIWQTLFGRALVPATDNFGVLGEAPSHPELLDHLASSLVREGWSTKRLLRRLALSRSYAMASRGDPAAAEKDPANLLLHRMPVRRLEAETLRDALLAVSGRLSTERGGPPVPTKLSSFQDGRGRPGDGPIDGAGRRSLYLSVRRNFLGSFQQVFDAPTPATTTGRRAVSNVPAQALALLNDPLLRDLAEHWAKAACARTPSARERAAAMWRTAFARPPEDAELLECLEFVRGQATLRRKPPTDPAPWGDLAHALFNAKEFSYLR